MNDHYFRELYRHAKGWLHESTSLAASLPAQRIIEANDPALLLCAYRTMKPVNLVDEAYVHHGLTPIAVAMLSRDGFTVPQELQGRVELTAYVQEALADRVRRSQDRG